MAKRDGFHPRVSQQLVKQVIRFAFVFIHVDAGTVAMKLVCLFIERTLTDQMNAIWEEASYAEEQEYFEQAQKDFAQNPQN